MPGTYSTDDTLRTRLLQARAASSISARSLLVGAFLKPGALAEVVHKGRSIEVSVLRHAVEEGGVIVQSVCGAEQRIKCHRLRPSPPMCAWRSDGPIEVRSKDGVWSSIGPGESDGGSPTRLSSKFDFENDTWIVSADDMLPGTLVQATALCNATVDPHSRGAFRIGAGTNQRLVTCLELPAGHHGARLAPAPHGLAEGASVHVRIIGRAWDGVLTAVIVAIIHDGKGHPQTEHAQPPRPMHEPTNFDGAVPNSTSSEADETDIEALSATCTESVADALDVAQLTSIEMTTTTATHTALPLPRGAPERQVLLSFAAPWCSPPLHSMHFDDGDELDDMGEEGARPDPRYAVGDCVSVDFEGEDYAAAAFDRDARREGGLSLSVQTHSRRLPSTGSGTGVWY